VDHTPSIILDENNESSFFYIECWSYLLILSRQVSFLFITLLILRNSRNRYKSIRISNWLTINHQRFLFIIDDAYRYTQQTHIPHTIPQSKKCYSKLYRCRKNNYTNGIYPRSLPPEDKLICNHIFLGDQQCAFTILHDFLVQVL